MTLEDDLRKSPVDRWDCSNGCKHLKRCDTRDDEAYDCTYWLDFPVTLSAKPHFPKPCGAIPAKRINGPHTDAPTLGCPYFEKSN